MRVVGINIPGSFWDSLPVGNLLYLFGTDGTLQVVSWETLLDSLASSLQMRAPMEFCFAALSDSQRRLFSRLLTDQAMADTLQSRLATLHDAGQTGIHVQSEVLARSTLAVVDNPFPFPHSDCHVVKSNVFVASPSGVFKGRLPRARRTSKTIPNRLTDLSVFGISLSKGVAALAAGSEGLFLLGTTTPTPDEAVSLSSRHCGRASWMKQGIYASSMLAHGYAIPFHADSWRRWHDDEEGELHPLREISDQDLVADLQVSPRSTSYSWGGGDTAFFLDEVERRVLVVKYRGREFPTLHGNTAEDSPTPAPSVQEIKLAPWKGSLVDAVHASFGLVLETDHAIVLIPWRDDSQPVTVPGHAVQCRTFMRGKPLSDHLHVVRPEGLSIYSLLPDGTAGFRR
jgi:hypothetical protein